jgi:hypothetical protein
MYAKCPTHATVRSEAEVRLYGLWQAQRGFPAGFQLEHEGSRDEGISMTVLICVQCRNRPAGSAKAI